MTTMKPPNNEHTWDPSFYPLSSLFWRLFCSVLLRFVLFQSVFIEGSTVVLHVIKCVVTPRTALRVICCAFAETMELSHWHRIAQWIHSFFNRKSVLPPTTNKKASSTSTSAINTEGVRSTRLSSVSSESKGE